jgi:hypothetical protein
MIAFSGAGMFLGYVVTIFLDIFATTTTTETEN